MRLRRRQQFVSDEKVWEIATCLAGYYAHFGRCHRRTGQHPFGGADRVLPEWIQWGGGVVAEIFRGPSIFCGVAEFFPLTAVTDPKFFFFPFTAITDPKFVSFKHVLCFARIISTLCPNSCRQTARIGGGQLPPLPPAPRPVRLWPLL